MKALNNGKDIEPLTSLQLMTSSCTGAFLTSIFMTPFDVVKVRLQSQQRIFMNQKCFLYCNGLMDHLCSCAATICNCATTICTNPKHGYWFNRPVPQHLNGTIDAFVKISRAEGIQSLWSALPPTLVVAIPNTVIYFTTYEQIHVRISKYYRNNGISDPFWSGGVAGAIARAWAVTVISPFELMRTKMQSETMTYRELSNVLRRHVATSGLINLWSGWVPTVLRDVPFSVLYWMSYENLKTNFHQTNPSLEFSMAAGGISGGIAGAVTLPLDVVKTHRQVEIGQNAPQAGSTVRMLAHIYKQYGVKGLFSGLVPRLAKVVPACAIMISSFEYAKSVIRGDR